MVIYSTTLDLSEDQVSFVENVVAVPRSKPRSAWRALTSFGLAVWTLVWLRDGDSFAQLGRHFGVSTNTASRYTTKTVAAVLGSAGPRRRMVLDGRLIPTTQRAARPAGYGKDNQDSYYSGKRHRHEANVQALIGVDGEPAFVGDARCGSAHDLTVAQADAIVDAAVDAGVEVLADSGYQSAGGTVRTSVKRPKHLGRSRYEERASRPTLTHAHRASMASRYSKAGEPCAWYGSAHAEQRTWSKPYSPSIKSDIHSPERRSEMLSAVRSPISAISARRMRPGVLPRPRAPSRVPSR